MTDRDATDDGLCVPVPAGLLRALADSLDDVSRATGDGLRAGVVRDVLRCVVELGGVSDMRGILELEQAMARMTEGFDCVD